MYESEANVTVASSTEIPAEILSRFAESRKTVKKRTLIPWGEHCTECVWPTCYTTCDLYSPRHDGRCRRFAEGMVRIPVADALNSYLLKVSFKRWAKMWAVANLGLHDLENSDRAERYDQQIAKVIQLIPLTSIRNTVSQKRYSLKKRTVAKDKASEERPNSFLIECYNPNSRKISITITVRPDGSSMAFQHLFPMAPGFNRHRVPVSSIERLLDLNAPFSVDLTPNEIEEGDTLYFGAMDFVSEAELPVVASTPATGGKKAICKCVVWDLDNTLWDGVLVEDGADKLRLKPGIPEILKQLDERGILLSIASKNNFDDAMAVIRKFQLEDYFLFPQISWNPKSLAMREIASNLNIGIDSLLFVDDSKFERGEVGSAVPEVMLLDALEYQNILSRPDCQSPVTEESRKRRLFYVDQQRRTVAEKDYRGEYETFLRDCNLRLTIRPMTEANLERVHELTQRTNQMNFSGNRYTKDYLRTLLQKGDMDTYVLDCEDRFGSYGTIGFCLVDPQTVRMTDLMFSCRIQGKRVEHGFLTHLLLKYRDGDGQDFTADFRKTKKNEGPGKVFDDMGFQATGDVDGVTKLCFPRSSNIAVDGIVAIEDSTVVKVAHAK